MKIEDIARAATAAADLTTATQMVEYLETKEKLNDLEVGQLYIAGTSGDGVLLTGRETHQFLVDRITSLRAELKSMGVTL